MATTVFVSPGVYTREQDFSVFASRIGITRLGLVGMTLKGPAFEPTRVRSADEFLARFGTTDPSLELPYVANAFLKQSGELTITRVLGKEGFDNSPAWIITSDENSVHAGATLAIIRSKYDNTLGTFLATNSTDLEIATVSTTLGQLVLSGSTGPLVNTSPTTSAITVSLDATRDDYIVKVLGRNPKKVAGDYGFYVESIFPNFIREAAKRNEISGLATAITFTNDIKYTDYKQSYSNPVTPWIVSKVAGNAVQDLFQFESISDGDSANKEIKISITNIDDVTNTFDVLIRSFNDTDAVASLNAIERFRNVTLDSTQPNYIAKVIGTTDEEYPRKSIYVTLNMAPGHLEETVPAGFRGYPVRGGAISDVNAPGIYYKTSYLSGESVFKTFLGISELGYTGHTSSIVPVNKAIQTIEADLFSFQGANTDGMEMLKGFHLEDNAPADFVSGAKAFSAYTKSERKFTLVPYGGFDGWNKYKNVTFTSTASDATNVNAFKEAIATMANPEVVDINLFATPGINYRDSQNIVKFALDVIESRADSLYIIDSPRITDASAKGTPAEAVINLQETGIDSNYAATYWPWIQIEDTNISKYVYISPTAEVVKAIALTDNVSFPWFAPAGLNRGTTSSTVVRADVRLTKDDRDVLYSGRINPMATFVQQGVVIFGQKTLQNRQSALDRINVRRLLLQVRRLISAASQTLLFEQNDQTLRDQFLSKVEPILLQIQNQRGLNAFRVVMDDTLNTPDVIDRNTLVGKIQIQPTRVAEFISLDFQVLPTGANFSDF
jgi:hypothetical protein